MFVKFSKKVSFFEELRDNSDFYFTHSYVLKNFSTKDILTTTDYNIDFVSSVANKNLYGVQFHPEKSQIKRPQDFKKFHKYLLNAKKRLIITLTFKNGVLYRTKKFIPDYRYTKNFVGLFSIDELILIDISTKKFQESFLKIIKFFSENCFVPISIGGGINSLKELIFISKVELIKSYLILVA